MQFPVPQFTDVEDRIIGPLTVKQFMILFGAGIIIFLGYSASKSLLVTIFFFVLFGMPALGLAFGKLNGRPIYSTFGFFLRYLSSPKVMVFHREAAQSRGNNFRDMDLEKENNIKNEPVSAGDTKAHLRELEKLLKQTEDKEHELLLRK